MTRSWIHHTRGRFVRQAPVGLGAPEEARATFNARRKPGDMRTWTGVGVDTYRPLKPSDAFARMTG